ncbi:MAG: protease HtpX, partial [Hyphomonadaceae bacterium]|nr:protease HtpX [Hyphomonadaceae bacterium]
MFRIGLFLATNLAVLAVVSVVMSLLGLDDSGMTALLFFCFILGFGGSFVSLMISKWMAKRSTGTVIIENPTTGTEKWLYDVTAELSKKAGIGMPEIGIFPSSQPNAFATGWNRNKSLVAVSSGLLDNFRRDEVKAVVAHEIGHVANGDMVTLALVQGITNTFVLFFSRIVARIITSSIHNQVMAMLGRFVIVMVLQMLFGILASIIVMWFSRRREFRADAMGARLTSTYAMIAALTRLKKPVPHSRQDRLPDEMAAFGISSG